MEPRPGAAWRGHRVAEGTEDFVALTGLQDSAHWPLLYPQVVGFRLQMTVLTDRRSSAASPPDPGQTRLPEQSSAILSADSVFRAPPKRASCVICRSDASCDGYRGFKGEQLTKKMEDLLQPKSPAN